MSRTVPLEATPVIVETVAEMAKQAKLIAEKLVLSENVRTFVDTAGANELIEKMIDQYVAQALESNMLPWAATIQSAIVKEYCEETGSDRAEEIRRRRLAASATHLGSQALIGAHYIVVMGYQFDQVVAEIVQTFRITHSKVPQF